MDVVVVVDSSSTDDRRLAESLADLCDATVVHGRTVHEAVERLESGEALAVVLSLRPSENSFTESIADSLQRFPYAPWIVVADRNDDDLLAHALNAGARHFVPLHEIPLRLSGVVDNALSSARAKRIEARLMSRVHTREHVFEIGCDYELIPAVVEYLQSNLKTAGLCDDADTLRVCIAMEEAMRNALFHGNLEISSEQRDGDSEVYTNLLSERQRSEPYRSRRLFVQIRLSEDVGTFVVRDEGPGFDPRSLPDPTDPDHLDRVSGRGVLLMRSFMDEVVYNPTGNQVTMVKRASARVAS